MVTSSSSMMGRQTRGGAQAHPQQLIDALNEDLTFELSAIAQYLTYAAKASGPYRRALAKAFRHEIPEETGHATILADKVAAMGGEPATEAAPVPPANGNLEMV